MTMTRYSPVRCQWIDVPDKVVALADRRTKAMLRACLHEPNTLRTLALSCYLQGIDDGFEAAESRVRRGRIQ